MTCSSEKQKSSHIGGKENIQLGYKKYIEKGKSWTTLKAKNLFRI